MAYSYVKYEGRTRVRAEINTLLEAIKINSLDAVKCLLKKDINKLDSDGYTPLARAVEKNNLEIVKYVVSKEADVCKVGRNGKTPLCLAVEQENLQMITFLLENGAKHTVQSAFLTAIETKNLEIISMLHEKGALVNYTYSDGHTPLTKAIESQHATVTKYLIDNGADLQVAINEGMNFCGHTLLTKATELDDFATVQCLIEHGADINCIDNNKKTALAIAAANCSFRICQYLIDSGADIQLAQPEVDNYRSWNDDFARYLASFKLQVKSEEAGHEEDIQ